MLYINIPVLVFKSSGKWKVSQENRISLTAVSRSQNHAKCKIVYFSKQKERHFFCITVTTIRASIVTGQQLTTGDGSHTTDILLAHTCCYL